MERKQVESSQSESVEMLLRQQLGEAEEARKTALSTLDNSEIVAALAEAASAWSEQDSELRRGAAAFLAQHRHMSAAMLEQGLGSVFSAITTSSMENLLKRECPDAPALERTTINKAGESVRLRGPSLVFHSLAGNVPGMGVPAIVCALLARSCCLLRDSPRQPIISGAFADTLAAVHPLLGSMVVATEWDAGDRRMESTAMRVASRVELYGSDETVDRMASRYGGRSIVEHGSRVSLGLVPAEADTDQWARGFAQDVAMYEGLGCLSMSLLLVEGPADRAARMSHKLGIELSRLQRLWPRGPQDLDLETSRRAFIGRAELSSAGNQDELLIRGRADGWVVHVDPRAKLAPGCGLRVVKIVPVKDRQATLELLESSKVPIAGVALGMNSDSRNWKETVNDVYSCDATLVCVPGQLQTPPLGWRQDGHQRLGDLLDWYRDEQA